MLSGAKTRNEVVPYQRSNQSNTRYHELYKHTRCHTTLTQILRARSALKRMHQSVKYQSPYSAILVCHTTDNSCYTMSLFAIIPLPKESRGSFCASPVQSNWTSNGLELRPRLSKRRTNTKQSIYSPLRTPQTVYISRLVSFVLRQPTKHVLQSFSSTIHEALSTLVLPTEWWEHRRVWALSLQTQSATKTKRAEDRSPRDRP